MMLDRHKAFLELQRILKRGPVVVVGTGASCALDPRFGMPELAKHLESTVDPGPLRTQWQQVVENLNSDCGLEAALNAVTEPALREMIVGATGAFVASVDSELAWLVGTGEKRAPLAGLLRKLVDGLPPSNPVQHVVTTNYDLLIEHTCDALAIPWTDGFAPGYISRQDWMAAEDSMLTLIRQPRGRKRVDVERLRPHVRLYKVHGSVSWFENKTNGALVRAERVVDDAVPTGWRRGMIAPGRMKLDEVGLHRSWFAQADEEIGSARALLIVGYGFNDVHIEQGMKKRVFKDGCPGIVVTRDPSDNIRDWVHASADLWAVCRNPGPAQDATIILGPGNVDTPLVCQGENLWKIADFTEAVM